MIDYNDIDLIVKVAKMCAKKAGLPDQDVISLSALRQALDIYRNLPETKITYVECQDDDELQLDYDYCTDMLSLWTVDDSDASVKLDIYQLAKLIKELTKIHRGMMCIKFNNLHAELASEDEEPKLNCECC